MAQLKNTTINDTGFIRLPLGTSAQRPSGTQGMVRYNTQTNVIEFFNGSSWIGVGLLDGSSQSTANTSAAAIKALTGTNTDGAYWINLPTVGAKPTFCLMNSSAAGEGGYMLAMKGTQGTTFNYNSSYWTSTNLLNESAMDRNDGDAKYDVFNYYTASVFVAFFPDLNNGGQTSGFGTGWHWRQAGQNTTALNRFQVYEVLSNNPRGESMWLGSGFSAQSGFQQYAFNYTGNGRNAVRWGFGWNNEGDQASNDVTSGIAPVRAGTSAGDHIYCCQSTTGVNRAVRFEIWVR